MPAKPVCITCHTTQSLLWRVSGNGHICHHCYAIESANGLSTNATLESEAAAEIKEEVKGEAEAESPSKPPPPPLTTANSKSTKKGGNRWTRSRSNNTNSNMNTSQSKQQSNNNIRGRGRRALYKKPPFKAPTSTATIITSESIYYKGSYMQVGDIVSMIDEDGGTYYAQIRGFMTDQYCEKSAIVTWLLPTTASPPPEECFDPATYIIGPEEDLPRKLDCMEFVMHAPSDYYKSVNNPYPPVEADAVTKSIGSFIWTTMEAKDR